MSSRPFGRRRTVSLKVVLGGIGAAVIVLPLALLFGYSYAVSRNVPAEPMMKLEFVAQDLARAVRIGKDGELRPRGRFEPTEGLRLVVAGADDRIILSSSASFSVGETVSVEAIAEAVAIEAKEVNFFAETIAKGQKRLGRYYAWFAEDFDPIKVRGSPAWLIILTALVGLAFALGVIVAAGLGRSVLRLERAAVRIAAGDLESSVSVRGVREIEALAATMNDMRASLKEDRDRRARFLASISHDLRTPLTSIGGYLEAIEDGIASDPATLERYVRIMRDKTRVLEGRIAGLLEFARIETGEWRMRFEEIELRSFLERLCDEFREDAALSRRVLSRDLAALGNLRSRADKALLGRAFENIIANAIRFSPEGGDIRVCASRDIEGRGYLVFVDDEGPGIPPGEREIVFEPFARRGPPSDSSGSGLGLFIARSVIRGHGWDISAGESPSGGGRIIVRIPSLSL